MEINLCLFFTDIRQFGSGSVWGCVYLGTQILQLTFGSLIRPELCDWYTSEKRWLNELLAHVLLCVQHYLVHFIQGYVDMMTCMTFIHMSCPGNNFFAVSVRISCVYIAQLILSYSHINWLSPYCFNVPSLQNFLWKRTIFFIMFLVKHQAVSSNVNDTLKGYMVIRLCAQRALYPLSY